MPTLRASLSSFLFLALLLCFASAESSQTLRFLHLYSPLESNIDVTVDTDSITHLTVNFTSACSVSVSLADGEPYSILFSSDEGVMWQANYTWSGNGTGATWILANDSGSLHVLLVSDDMSQWGMAL